jgi:membrane-associated phospholipid phosphatase
VGCDVRVRGVRAPAALPRPVRVPLAVVSVLAAAVVLVLGLMFGGESTGTAFDEVARANLIWLPSPWFQIAQVIDFSAELVGGVLVLGTLVLVFWHTGYRRAAVLAVVGTGLSVAATVVLKPLVGRTINDGFLSFPSGHTATATSLTLVVALVLGQRRAARTMLLITVPAAVAMAWSQIVLNTHYATDTVGGFCTALAVVPPTAWVVDKVADRVSSARTP